MTSLFAPLTTHERQHLFKATAATPGEVERLLGNLSIESIQRKQARDFSLHEHVWHLADVEVMAYANRFNLVMSEERPQLMNFDGDRIAAERNYHLLPLARGLRAFADARLRNLWLLSGANGADWMRTGQQEGVGTVTLASLFRSLLAHDQAHIAQIKHLLGVPSAISNHVAA